MTGIVISPETEADLVDIEEKIAGKTGADIAARFTGRILATILLLSRVPLASGRLIPQLGRDLRCHPHGNYNIYLRYLPASDEFQVVRILHSRRNISARLFER